MPWFRFSLVLAILLLLFALTANAQTVVQPCYCTWYYWKFTFTSPGYIVLASADPHTFNLAVFTAQNYDLWWAGNAEPAVYYGSISYGDMVAIPITEPGNYTVVIYPIPNLQYTPQIFATNYSYVGLPIGIVSYPLAPITTNELMGFFNITAISAYNPNGESQYNVPNSGASLQLNAVVVVELANGQKQYYWVQDVIGFITDRDEFHIWDNVWNYTTQSSVLSSQAITGNGEVYLYKQTNSQYYYYGTPFNTYTLPMSGYLIMKAYVSDGVVYVEFGYVIIQDGGYEPPSVVWFDNVSIIPSAPAVNAYFEVSTELATSQHPLDAELVFTGYANSEWTMFNQLSANLAILYWGGSAWVPLPRLFDFGVDTAEGSAPNISVSVGGNGFATVSLGSFSPGLVAGEVPTPALPMTCVSYSNPVANQYFSGYITQPMTISFPSTVYVSSNERYVFQGYFVNNEFLTNSSITITPSETWFTQYDVEPVYQLQYLVSIVSPLPIYVNGEEAVNYTNWLSPGSQVSIVVLDYVFPNGTMFIPGVGNETITVNAPTTLAINWSPRYLVTVTSTMPIYVNGQLVSNYTAWLSPGTALTIRAPTYSAYGGLVLYQPNTTSTILTISKPTKLTITYTPNYDRLYIAIGAAVTTIALVTVIPMSRRKQRRH